MSRKNKKSGVTEEKVTLEFDVEEELDGGDFILKLQEAYSELINKGCPKTFVSVKFEEDFDEDGDVGITDLVLVFSGQRQRSPEELQKEEAKKLEEKRLTQELEELKKKLAELKKL